MPDVDCVAARRWRKRMHTDQHGWDKLGGFAHGGSTSLTRDRRECARKARLRNLFIHLYTNTYNTSSENLINVDISDSDMSDMDFTKSIVGGRSAGSQPQVQEIAGVPRCRDDKEQSDRAVLVRRIAAKTTVALLLFASTSSSPNTRRPAFQVGRCAGASNSFDTPPSPAECWQERSARRVLAG
jgi:hypothetical protein